MKDVVSYLKEDSCLRDILHEFTKFVRIIITLPDSSSTNERSFSALKRLKTYLRSTMLQNRLNDLAILHIHQEYLENMNLKEVIHL